jgi:glucosyl-3-phosphoglycerate synthase
MGDFYQVGVISTLHKLDTDGPDRLEAELARYARVRPVGLVIPALYSEFEGPALPRILETLASVRYLRRVVVSLDAASPEQFALAKQAVSAIKSAETAVLWQDGPAMQELYSVLREQQLLQTERGKGRACWMSAGYVLACADCDVIAMHDADITTYDREVLARLCYPIAHPALGYEFCKGYYPRVSRGRMYGRATRLLMTPLIRSLYKIVGYLPILVYLDSFRYILAGEVAMVSDLARVVRTPSDWGLEVGTLGEVYRNTSTHRVCQVALTSRYDHKHQDLSPDDQSHGLFRMSVDICQSILRTLASEGVTLSTGTLQTLVATYLRTAEDTIKRFHDDAAINGLTFDRQAEEVAVETFTKGIRIAGRHYLERSPGGGLIPNWNRVVSAIPDFLQRLKAAVEADNQ